MVSVVHEIKDEGEPDLKDVLSWLSPSDLIIVEGYKSAADIPKIEARRTASVDRRPLAPDDPSFIAIAADHAVSDASVPVFDLDDISGIADFIDKVIGPLRQRVCSDGRVARSTASGARSNHPADDSDR